MQRPRLEGQGLVDRRQRDAVGRELPDADVQALRDRADSAERGVAALTGYRIVGHAREARRRKVALQPVILFLDVQQQVSDVTNHRRAFHSPGSWPLRPHPLG